MKIKQKLDRALTESLLSESRRMRPAKILTARGVTINADHARIVRHPMTGTRIIVMGIGPENVTKIIRRYQNVRIHKYSLTGMMRDFTAPGEWVPDPTNPALVQIWNAHGMDIPWQDESGWSYPNHKGKYNARRIYVTKKKFKVILTAFVDNIRSIKWLD